MNRTQRRAKLARLPKNTAFKTNVVDNKPGDRPAIMCISCNSQGIVVASIPDDFAGHEMIGWFSMRLKDHIKSAHNGIEAGVVFEYGVIRSEQ